MKLVRRPSRAKTAVNRARHARAWAQVTSNDFGGVAQIIQQMGLNHVLDLGCGPAALLVHLAERNHRFFGWGVEMNAAMCRLARARIRTARVAKQVKVFEGDITRLRAALPEGIRSQIHALTACQCTNEMFGTSRLGIVKWLRRLKKMFPGLPLVLFDYYGRLGGNSKGPDRETWLHDYAQLISGQGVPPANYEEWRAVYERAGCHLAHVVEDQRTTRFVHLVLL